MSDAKPSKLHAAPTKRLADGHEAALTIEEVDINEHCTGSRWSVDNLNLLARIISIITMGQAAHAAQIIAELAPAEPAINNEALRADAKKALSIKGGTDNKRRASRYHRDGLIFEVISWVAAQHATKGKALLRDPHIKSTTQGLDGLMIELDETLSTKLAVPRFSKTSAPKILAGCSVTRLWMPFSPTTRNHERVNCWQRQRHCLKRRI